MRRNILETPEFKKIKLSSNEKNTTFFTAFQGSPRSIICTMLMASFVGVITFGTYVYSVTYLTQYCNFHLSTAIVIVSFSLLLDAILEPFIALLADKYGNGRLISMLGTMGFALFSYPLFRMLSSGDLILTTIAMLCFSCLIAVTCAPMNTTFVLLFPAKYRYTGFGVSFNLSIAIFGGTAPLVLEWLIHRSNNIMSPTIYYIGSCIIGLIALSLIKPTVQLTKNNTYINDSLNYLKAR